MTAAPGNFGLLMDLAKETSSEKRRELLPLNEMTGPAFKLRRDPRVTWIGRFLRRFSLDERLKPSVRARRRATREALRERREPTPRVPEPRTPASRVR